MPGATGASPAVACRRRQRRAEHALEVGARHAAGPQQGGAAETGDDGGFHPDRRRAAVEDEVDAPAQVAEHMGGRGRRDMAGAVGRGRHHRRAEGFEQRMRQRMCRHAHGHAVEPGAGQVGHRAAGRQRQHQGQRSRPERGRQPLGGRVEAPKRPGGGDIGHVGDQGIERRPPLGGVEPGHRLAVAGVGAEPIDGLGREGDQPPGRKAGRGRPDGLGIGPSTRVPGSAVMEFPGFLWLAGRSAPWL